MNAIMNQIYDDFDEVFELLDYAVDIYNLLYVASVIIGKPSKSFSRIANDGAEILCRYNNAHHESFERLYKEAKPYVNKYLVDLIEERG